MSEYIVLLDPSLMDNNNTPSYNLGDLIINESVMKIISDLFPNVEVKRISSHVWITDKEREIINQSLFTFVGGSNILTSNIKSFTRLTPEKRRIRYLFPNFKNVILIGAGWADYQDSPDIYTKVYYSKILNKKYYQSLRDSYTMFKLNRFFKGKLINTSCPTTWEIDIGFNNKYKPESNKILFTLTDYNQDKFLDTKLIELIFSTEARELFFFPQGTKDLEYLSKLKIYRDNRSKIKILNHDFNEYKTFVKENDFNYVGTRLHGGIYCLQNRMPSLIVGIDNRAVEIKKDIDLNVVERNNFAMIEKWLKHGGIPAPMNIPTKNIEKWKKQFQNKTNQ